MSSEKLNSFTPARKLDRKTTDPHLSSAAYLYGLCFFGLLLLGCNMISSISTEDKPNTYSESDALLVIQNFKPPANKGMTCIETFDAIVYVYNNDLGISDATVKWSVTKQSDTVFIVHADLKGETGWANYRWKVEFPEQEITALDELSLCKPYSNPSVKVDTPKPETHAPQGNKATEEPISESTIEPTSLPASIVKTGTGNSVVSIEKWDGPALIHIKGGSSANPFFSVKNDDGLFFLGSGIDQYDGVKVLDFFPGTSTKSFEIQAEGEWSIGIYPLQGDFMEERILDVPGKYQGNDDDVLFIEEGKYQIIVEGNSASANFSIWAHGEYGESYLLNQDLLVNVIDPYKGTIDLPEWVRILEIEAVGPWTVEIKNR